MLGIFFVFKFFSDISLSLDRPTNFLWYDINLGFATVKYDLFFLSNVDTILGLILMSFVYFFSISKFLFPLFHLVEI